MFVRAVANVLIAFLRPSLKGYIHAISKWA